MYKQLVETLYQASDICTRTACFASTWERSPLADKWIADRIEMLENQLQEIKKLCKQY